MTASQVFEPFDRTAYCLPDVGLVYAVIVCGSRPFDHPPTPGMFGTASATQSTRWGTPVPAVPGSWIAPMALPPNSPVTIPRCEFGAMAMPHVPAEKLENSGIVTVVLGADQLVPANVAWDRSVMNRLLVN